MDWPEKRLARQIGINDSHGIETVPSIYPIAPDFESDMARVFLHGKSNFTDKTGKRLKKRNPKT